MLRRRMWLQPVAGLCLALLAPVAWLAAQSSDTQAFPPVDEAKIQRITALRTREAIHVDGQLDEASWQATPQSPPFVDLVSGKPAMHATHVRVLWDDVNLYVGYTIEEPNVQAKFTQRDSPIYQENDVEIFIAGDDAYYEFEINALGTVYEGLFIWQSVYETAGYPQLPGLNRHDPQVKSQEFRGVGFTRHPRGPRWAFLDWDFPRAQTAVHVDGTLNDASDRDRGWTVELAFPWQELAVLDRSQPRPLPPPAGAQWRIDFSRFNQYKAPPPADDSGGWALSYHGVWDSHIPECFPYVTFSATVAEQP